MTKEQKLKKLKSIIEKEFDKKLKSIKLCEVLIVMNKFNKYFQMRNFFPYSVQFEDNGKILAVWDLGKKIDDQEEKTLDFLLEKLSKTNDS